MRISDWSSDVCSSDLLPQIAAIKGKHRVRALGWRDGRQYVRCARNGRANGGSVVKADHIARRLPPDSGDRPAFFLKRRLDPRAGIAKSEKSESGPCGRLACPSRHAKRLSHEIR